METKDLDVYDESEVTVDEIEDTVVVDEISEDEIIEAGDGINEETVEI